MNQARLEVSAATAQNTKELGTNLATHLRAGDLVILGGGLGAGKTTLTQGIAAGLGVHGRVTSPTFVIARSHRSVAGGPHLVHVDAYRLGSIDELIDLDLDTSLEDSVTVVEWGAGLAEQLSVDRLLIDLDAEPVETSCDVSAGTPGGEFSADFTRRIILTGIGRRWEGAAWQALSESTPGWTMTWPAEQ